MQFNSYRQGSRPSMIAGLGVAFLLTSTLSMTTQAQSAEPSKKANRDVLATKITVAVTASALGTGAVQAIRARQARMDHASSEIIYQPSGSSKITLSRIEQILRKAKPGDLIEFSLKPDGTIPGQQNKVVFFTVPANPLEKGKLDAIAQEAMQTLTKNGGAFSIVSAARTANRQERARQAALLGKASRLWFLRVLPAGATVAWLAASPIAGWIQNSLPMPNELANDTGTPSPPESDDSLQVAADPLSADPAAGGSGTR